MPDKPSLPRLPIVAVILAALLLAVGLVTSQVSSSAAQAGNGGKSQPACGPNWVLVDHPNPSTADNYLHSVAATSSNDVWAAGTYYDTAQFETTSTIEHWNGTAWSNVSIPHPSGNPHHYLYGVSASGPNDAWAVGNISQFETLIMHWDGSTWSIVPSPSVPAASNKLMAVVAISPTDAWAVGTFSASAPSQALMMHWNGAAWSIVSAPTVGDHGDYLTGVAATGPNDVWAVGYSTFGAGPDKALAMQYNGTAWNAVLSPHIGDDRNWLQGVAAIAPNDVWAVGFATVASWDTTLIHHWNGSQWSIVTSANVAGSGNLLHAVAAGGPNNVWAVGESYISGGSYQTLVERWNGSAWSIMTTPRVGSAENTLEGVAVASSNPLDVWAVGYGADGSPAPYVSMIERYNPCTTEPTPTPTGTPSGCTIQYPDVQPGSTFYDYVHCLACRGIVSGYPNGTFGPGNPVTRGQLAKIVSNAAAYNENFTTNTFEDVAVGSTFFLFVERLYAHGGIQGYACGGTGEPCNPPANKPYYRPNANVTRGQTCKIVATARGLPPPTPGQQTFEDVIPNSTFWNWIESLVATGAIQGYACGNPEPCVPPGNKPYFRPSANVTRGQSAKIVVNAFFPGCTGARSK